MIIFLCVIAPPLLLLALLLWLWTGSCAPLPWQDDDNWL
jgi:hypothetical protein